MPISKQSTILIIIIIVSIICVIIYIGYEEQDNQLQTLEYFDNLQSSNNVETFEPISQNEQYLQNMRTKIQALIDDQIQNPVQGTDSDQWAKLKASGDMQNIQSTSKVDQILNKQIAYTINKGKITKIPTNINPDVNTYILIHELAHAYDPKYLNGHHDKYFWILFSKLVQRSIQLGILDESVFNKKQSLNNMKILSPNDYQKIQNYAQQPLPQRL